MRNPEIELHFNMRRGHISIKNKDLAKKLGDIQKEKVRQEKEDKRIEEVLNRRSW